MNNIEAGPRDMVYNVKNYPDFIKAAPFCCWKQGKVPYNPITGKRAKVDETATFGTLEEAYRAYMGNSLYKGIGLKVSGRLGAIDLDKCVGDDVAKEFKPFALSSLSENAQKVLSMFPNAVVELSPSRTGLHLFFIVPEGFSFDRDEYYINNRNLGIEVYFPEITNRFLTVTGSLINTQQAAQAAPTAQTPTADNETAVNEAKNNENKQAKKEAANDAGNGFVSSDALQEFLNRFMKRPAAALVAIKLPEGGSILSDEEVKQKAAKGKNGERFNALYEGDWFKFGGSDVNWSQSEADIELCGILAFYCRGDINQMDRLFRASGLMRDKWDEARGDSTYGAITMNNAVANCHFFYDPKSEWEQKIDSFRALIDKIASEGNASTETLLSEETLMAAAWAIENDFARYVKLKKLIPSEIGVRAYEKQLKNCVLPSEPALPSSPLVLTGVEDTGLCVPKGWIVNDDGVTFIKSDGGKQLVTEFPIYVKSRLIDIDSGDRKLEVAFRDGDKYNSFVAPRADVRNKYKIISFANAGIDAESETTAMLTKFIAAMENANIKTLPFNRCISKAGWRGLDLIPLSGGKFLIDDDEDKTLAHIKTLGLEEIWMILAEEVRKHPLARAMLAVSFASPLIEKLGQRIIYYHSWGNSRSGKTASLLFAMSVWGDPFVLKKTYLSTLVGLERTAAMLRHLPLGLDEMQNIDKRLSLNTVVYTLGNGSGKTRGKASGGTKNTDEWNNCILSTGEQPISFEESTMDGMKSRVLEIYGTPIPDEELGAEIHQLLRSNYGFAGPKFVKFLVDEVLTAAPNVAEQDSEKNKPNTETKQNDTKQSDADWRSKLKVAKKKSVALQTKLFRDFEIIKDTLSMFYGKTEPKLPSIAIIALADYYSSISIFGLNEEQAFKEAISLGGEILETIRKQENRDVIDRAWFFVRDWVAGNEKKFENSPLSSSSEVYGIIQDGKVFALVNALNKALEDAHFVVKKCVSGFAERGYIHSYTDKDGVLRTQHQKKVNGINARVYALEIEVDTSSFSSDEELLKS